MSESEQLMVVDEAGHPLYTATRQDVHTQGLWHETFHCFVIDSIKQQVVLQQRADQKKDFPGMLDITAAGHLLAGESVADGVRELEEEIGLVKSFEELHGLGVYQEELCLPGFIDRERIHLFLTDSAKPLTGYSLQKTEVRRLLAFSFAEFARLTEEETTVLTTVEGETIQRNQFVPHPTEYWKTVYTGILAFSER